MDENKLKTIIESAIKQAVDPVNHRLDGIESTLNNPDTGLAAINRRLDANTAAIIELEGTVKGYADMYKINDANIRKTGMRVKTLEKKAKVNVPPELELEPLPETV